MKKMEALKASKIKLEGAALLALLLKINEMIDGINKTEEQVNAVGQRIGLMEDEFKQHLYGAGYKQNSEQEIGGHA